MDHGDEDTLAESLWAVARRLRMVTHDLVTPFGITPAQARALGMLRRHGPMRLSDLSSHLRIVPRSGTEVVDALEERGLVARSPDPQDRRATLVALTADGEKTSQAVQSARAAEADTFFSSLSTEDRDTLARLLQSLRQYSQAGDPGRGPG